MLTMIQSHNEQQLILWHNEKLNEFRCTQCMDDLLVNTDLAVFVIEGNLVLVLFFYNIRVQLYHPILFCIAFKERQLLCVRLVRTFYNIIRHEVLVYLIYDSLERRTKGVLPISKVVWFGALFRCAVRHCHIGLNHCNIFGEVKEQQALPVVEGLIEALDFIGVVGIPPHKVVQFGREKFAADILRFSATCFLGNLAPIHCGNIKFSTGHHQHIFFVRVDKQFNEGRIVQQMDRVQIETQIATLDGNSRDFSVGQIVLIEYLALEYFFITFYAFSAHIWTSCHSSSSVAVTGFSSANRACTSSWSTATV